MEGGGLRGGDGVGGVAVLVAPATAQVILHGHLTLPRRLPGALAPTDPSSAALLLRRLYFASHLGLLNIYTEA